MPDRLWTITALVAIAGSVMVSAAQLRPSPEAPAWNRVARLTDGRVFVTDGNILLETGFARPDTVPTETVATAWLQSFLSAAQPNEARFQDLTLKTLSITPVYTSPTGSILNPKYVDYLRRVFGDSKLSFRYNGALDPIQIVWNSAVVGALMPMKP